jgi:hypothetical protein
MISHLEFMLSQVSESRPGAPGYSDEEKFEAIRVGTATYALLSSIFCQAASGVSEKDGRSEAIEAKYAELYGATA